MKRVIFALGGGYGGEHRNVYRLQKPAGGQEYWPVDTEPVDRLIAAASPKKNPRILLLSTPSEDGNKDVDLMYRAFADRFVGHGCRPAILKLIQARLSGSEIEAAIGSADIIYVSGGNTHRAMRRWRALGVDRLLLEAYQAGTPMAGLSAGAICWFSYGCSNSFYTNKPFRVRGLGWIEALMCPHYDAEPFRQQPFHRMLKKTPKLAGIALGEYAAIEIVDQDRCRFHSYGPGSQIQIVRYSPAAAGGYVYNQIEPSAEYRPLKPLLGLA